MTDEDFHRLEHKVDELIGYLRNSSLARQGDIEALNSVANFVPSQPNESDRVCPVCTHIVTITPDPKFDPTKGILAGALKRNCNCKVITVK